jgi:hypothetical protein
MRLLENECIPPTRCDIHERGKNTMDKMAATQEVLSQYRHVVGTKRQKNDGSNIIQEGTSRRRDRQTLENFYYEAIYTALQEENLRDTTFLKLKN